MTDRMGRQPENEAAERDWDADEDALEVVRTVGRLVRLWRERAGMTQAELGAAIGYGAEHVSSVERARRIPKPEFLRAADEVLGAGGILAAMAEDVARARYPKKVRDLARLEADAVELGAYSNSVVHGLLQTEEYTRALFRMRRPRLDEDTIERQVAARMARQSIFDRRPAPVLSFVQEEVTLLRPLGGRMVWRRQLEHLLALSCTRHVDLQVMPTDREDNAGVGGPFVLLEPMHGPKVAHAEAQRVSGMIVERSDVRALEARFGLIRAQALTPRESLAFIEKLLGETCP